MARTAAQAIAAAREILGDEDGGAGGATYRTSDDKLLGFAVDALNAIRNIRPDLFVGNWGALTLASTSAALPVDDQFFRPIVNFMAACAELKDDDAVNNGRAKLLADLTQGFLR